MSAYGNYQLPSQYASAPPAPDQYAQQQPGQPQQAPPQMAPPPPPQQQQFDPMSGNQQQLGGQQVPLPTDPWASAPPAVGRAPLRRSLSMGSAQQIQQSMASVSFDPYASVQTAPAVPAAASPYNNYTMAPPSYPGNEEMTTTGPTSTNFAFAQQPSPMAQSATTFDAQPFDAGASVVSDISLFTNVAPGASPTAASPLVPATGTAVVPKKDEKDEFIEAHSSKAIKEQEKILRDIQARNKMASIRKNHGVTNSSAMVPHRGANGQMVPRQAPPRSRSMPGNARGQQNSLAHGGVAVLDPKKDKRKQTRKMKTASGAVGGAVLGGLILGPVGVVLGAGGGAAASNKMAKSRDKRKQQEFEQKNFQKGASQSVAAKGDGSFV